MAYTTGKTITQTAAVLVTAGALQDQAVTALHTLAWAKQKPHILWGVLIQCTSGWNTGDPVFEYDIAPT